MTETEIIQLATLGSAITAMVTAIILFLTYHSHKALYELERQDFLVENVRRI